MALECLEKGNRAMGQKKPHEKRNRGKAWQLQQIDLDGEERGGGRRISEGAGEKKAGVHPGENLGGAAPYRTFPEPGGGKEDGRDDVSSIREKERS